jgi:hypothetical protein
MTRADRWTVAAVLALAALLRLEALGRAPLDAGEAAHAWRALRLARAGDASVAGLTSPFAAGTQAVVFAFVGAGDALARVPAAACGLALVLVPLVAWAPLGRERALLLCVLLAFDARLVEWSRRATGEAAAALPPLAVAACALRPWDAAQVRPGRLLAAAAAAALAGSTAGFVAIPWASAISASLTEAIAGAPAPAGVAPLTLVLAAAGLAGVPGRRALVYLAAIAWGALVASGSPLTLACVACAGDGLGTLLGTRPRLRHALAGALAVVLIALRAPAPGPVDPALRDLANDAVAIAVERGHAAGEMPVVIVGHPPDARIAWALRDLRSVEWAPVRPTRRPVAPLLVAHEGATGTPGAYTRRTYGTGPGAVALWVPHAP